jgi:chromosomal replication initiator protein
MQTIVTDELKNAEKQSTVNNEIDRINDALAEKIGPQKYRIWFKNSTKLALTENYLKVDVPNFFIASWLENHFSEHISEAVKQATGRDRKVTFTIDPQLTGHQRQNQLDSQALSVENAVKPAFIKPDKSQTDLKRKLKLSLDTFVVGRSNELAFNAAKAVAKEQHSPFNPLFIHGGYGLGKTHLLQGICNEVSKSRPGTDWLYLSAEDFANQFILALKTKKLEAFRRRMRRTELLAIDDVHFLASKPSTQEEFLHTFNAINLAGKQVILASDAHPKMIGQLSEKLINRFVSGMVVKIESPDLETRCQICAQYARKIKKFIPESVIRYIAENLRTNVRELEGALLKLIAYASLQNKKINLIMAKDILADHIARTDPIVHISDIESAVSTFFGITPASLHSSKKDRTISLARHFSMYLARKHTKMSFPEIGRFMGNKNHATVLLACKKIEEQIRTNTQLNWHGLEGNRANKARAILSKLEKCIST